MAGRRLGLVHQGLLHGPGAGGPHRQPRRQGPRARSAACVVDGPGPAPGTVILLDGAEVGHVTSSAIVRVARRDRAGRRGPGRRAGDAPSSWRATAAPPPVSGAPAAMRWSAALLGAGLLAGACSRGSSGADLRPHPLPGVGHVGRRLQRRRARRRVPGNTTTTAPEPGTASIVGSVSGPERARARGHGAHRAPPRRASRCAHDVTTGPDGKLRAAQHPRGSLSGAGLPRPVPGAHHPRRPLPPRRASRRPSTSPCRTSARSWPGPPWPREAPFLGDDVNLAIVVANRTVDGDGIVQSIPLPGLRVELTGLGRLPADGAGPGRRRLLPADHDDPGRSRPARWPSPTPTARSSTRCSARPRARPTLALLVDVTVTPAQVAGQPPGPPPSRCSSWP